MAGSANDDAHAVDLEAGEDEPLYVSDAPSVPA